jgi:hypothetical protein
MPPQTHSQSIDRDLAQKGHPIDAPASDTSHGERILLVTVQNAKYPITPDIFQAVTAQYGRLVRVLIAQRDTLMALLEYPLIRLVFSFVFWFICLHALTFVYV